MANTAQADITYIHMYMDDKMHVVMAWHTLCVGGAKQMRWYTKVCRTACMCQTCAVPLELAHNASKLDVAL